jgi:hypothetical protein
MTHTIREKLNDGMINKRTYHNVHRGRPRAHSSITLDIVISLGFIENLSEAVLPANIPRCTTDILQLEDSFDNLGNRHLSMRYPRAQVEPGTVDGVVQRLRPARVDGSRLREFKRLVVVMAPLNAR